MLNDCKFIGRLVRDSNDQGVYEVKNIGGKERKIYKNAIAVERDYKDSSGKRPVDFVDFTAWDARADFLKNWAAKGKLILVGGRMEINSRGEGENYRKYVDINVSDIQILEWPDKREESAMVHEEDVPF